mmetsp:Transcript_36097/g.102696  ORF Transcript_36097/g.102696 Transcript_36097/m.102696 type:complete len:232 (+) Transcript_36097:80-775(+)
MCPSIHKVPVEDQRQRGVLHRVAEGDEIHKKITELAVDVAEDLAGRLGGGQHGLRAEELGGDVGEQHERVQVFRAEEIGQQRLVGPLGIELVGFLGQLLRQIYGLLDDDPSPLLQAEDHAALADGVPILALDEPVTDRLVFQLAKVKNLTVQDLSDQGSPTGDDLGVRCGVRPLQHLPSAIFSCRRQRFPWRLRARSRRRSTVRAVGVGIAVLSLSVAILYGIHVDRSPAM